MILAAGMFVQYLEAVVEIAYQFKAYIEQGALKHSVKRRAGVFSHPPAGGIVAVFGNKLQGGLAGEPGVQVIGPACCFRSFSSSSGDVIHSTIPVSPAYFLIEKYRIKVYVNRLIHRIYHELER
jgi:hypothetical protein